MIIVLRELSRSDTIHGTSPVVQKFKRLRVIPFRELTHDFTSCIIRRAASNIGLKRNWAANTSQNIGYVFIYEQIRKELPGRDLQTSSLRSKGPRL